MTRPLGMTRRPITRALLLLLAVVALAATGCTKRVAVSTSDVNIADGREFEVQFKGDRVVSGRFVSGSEVRFEQGDSLFTAEVGEVTDEFIGLSSPELVVESGRGGDWTDLRLAAEDAHSVVERPQVGNALLARDEVESVSLITIDRRRSVVETVFWAGLILAVGLAATAE